MTYFFFLGLGFFMGLLYGIKRLRPQVRSEIFNEVVEEASHEAEIERLNVNKKIRELEEEIKSLEHAKKRAFQDLRGEMYEAETLRQVVIDSKEALIQQLDHIKSLRKNTTTTNYEEIMEELRQNG